MTNTSKQLHYDQMLKALLDKGCTPISISTKSVPMVYICCCGSERKQLYRDFIRRNCRVCKSKSDDSKTVSIGEKQIDSETGEIWIRIKGGWISSFGKAKKRLDGELLTLCPSKFRYYIDGHNQYATRLVALAFKIDGYEHLTYEDGSTNHKFGVGMRNPFMKEPQAGYLENLYVHSKEDIGKRNGSKSGKMNECKSLHPRDFVDLEYREIPDISENHLVYENGEIWNGKWFLQGSKSSGYRNVCGLNGNSGDTHKVHRIVCYAFHPIEGYTCFDDYKHLQVNHIDGNPENNHKDNLEWSDQSKNMSHAYHMGLNKKVRGILQYEKGTEQLIGEYYSIAEASRQTGEREHNIREFANGKYPCRTRKYDWRYKNPELSQEYSRKYRSYK